MQGEIFAGGAVADVEFSLVHDQILGMADVPGDLLLTQDVKRRVELHFQNRLAQPADLDPRQIGFAYQFGPGGFSLAHLQHPLDQLAGGFQRQFMAGGGGGEQRTAIPPHPFERTKLGKTQVPRPRFLFADRMRELQTVEHPVAKPVFFRRHQPPDAAGTLHQRRAFEVPGGAPRFAEGIGSLGQHNRHVVGPGDGGQFVDQPFEHPFAVGAEEELELVDDHQANARPAFEQFVELLQRGRGMQPDFGLGFASLARGQIAGNLPRPPGEQLVRRQQHPAGIAPHLGHPGKNGAGEVFEGVEQQHVGDRMMVLRTAAGERHAAGEPGDPVGRQRRRPGPRFPHDHNQFAAADPPGPDPAFELGEGGTRGCGAFRLLSQVGINLGDHMIVCTHMNSRGSVW